MIGVEHLILFLHQYVKVGCPHLFDSMRIFWYFGRLIEVNDDTIVIQEGQSLRSIPIKQILTIERDTRSR